MFRGTIFLPLAVIGLGSHADAADLAPFPPVVEPISYVQVCERYGAGYFVIPGTETCLRVAGRIRTDVQFQDFGSRPSNWSQRDENDVRFRARAYVYLDAFTETEFGLLRAYSETRFTSDSDTVRDDDEDDTLVDLEVGYIQFGGFTFGRTQSFFDFFTGATYGAVDRNFSDDKTWVAAYTASMGGPVSFSVSVEDISERVNGTFDAVTDLDGSGGNRWPAGVVALRGADSWGSAQVSAAIQEARPLSAAADSEMGLAFGAGVIFNLPMLAQGDALALQVQYAEAAMSYIGATDVFDSYYDGTRTRKTKGFALSGGFTHYFTPEVRTDFDASYAQVDTPRGAPQNDYTRYALDFDVAWTPVPGLEFGVDIGYANIDPDNEKTSEEASAILRAQRTF
ncbi:porin [Pseudovibrio exalbescens]|uniref:porin n=1 Tax=Pseudovibrio exalbescens TaxID=197461 RepID=UPI0023656EDC|nr:porin [Pseudovibrio exalbescens]MDD7908354.1 porin [Pseudovibrio exalbescens]